MNRDQVWRAVVTLLQLHAAADGQPWRVVPISRVVGIMRSPAEGDAERISDALSVLGHLALMNLVRQSGAGVQLTPEGAATAEVWCAQVWFSFRKAESDARR
jgi:hypothetical protein